MSCIRDNKVCTKCCEAIHLSKKLKLKGLNGSEGDGGFVATNWKKLSTRLAKKKNPHIFSSSLHGKVNVKYKKKQFQFYTCKNLTEKGCGKYSERPRTCSQFPHYGRTNEEYHTELAVKPADYSQNCTVHYNIPIKFLG